MSSKSYFDTVGADWDRLRESFFSERVRERALAAAGVEEEGAEEGGLAADVGAGTGFITQALVERGLRVIAIDQSEPMLEALRGKLPAAAEVDARVGEARHLPVDDASVGYCFANMVLHHVDEPAAAIREMARILEPGGRLVITDLDTHDHAFLRDEHHDRWMGFEHEDIRTWFRDAGLRQVDVECLDESCCTTPAEGQPASISIFLATGEK